MKYDVVTSIKMYHESKSDFPAVSICLLDSFANELKNDFESGFKNNSGDQDVFGKLSSSTIEQWLKIFHANEYIMSKNEAFQAENSWTLNDSVLSCTYNLAPCSMKDFTWYYNDFYGKCFEFKSNLPNTVADLIHGLHMEFYIGPENKNNNHTVLRGLLIDVHNRSSLPNEQSGINISPAFQTNIEVMRTYDKRLQQPYNNCLKDGEESVSFLHRFMKSLNLTYNQK